MRGSASGPALLADETAGNPAPDFLPEPARPSTRSPRIGVGTRTVGIGVEHHPGRRYQARVEPDPGLPGAHPGPSASRTTSPPGRSRPIGAPFGQEPAAPRSCRERRTRLTRKPAAQSRGTTIGVLRIALASATIVATVLVARLLAPDHLDQLHPNRPGGKEVHADEPAPGRGPRRTSRRDRDRRGVCSPGSRRGRSTLASSRYVARLGSFSSSVTASTTTSQSAKTCCGRRGAQQGASHPSPCSSGRGAADLDPAGDDLRGATSIPVGRAGRHRRRRSSPGCPSGHGPWRSPRPSGRRRARPDARRTGRGTTGRCRRPPGRAPRRLPMKKDADQVGPRSASRRPPSRPPARPSGLPPAAGCSPA